MIKRKKILNLIPNEYQKTIFDVDFNKLYERGYRIILTDLDNTLVSYDEQYPTEEIMDFIKKVKDIGFEIVVTSNNKKKRVKAFCSKAKIEGIWFSLKPFKFGFRRALKNKNYKKEEIIVMGDQLLTDVVSGNRCGYYVILIKAVKRKTEKLVTRINRKREIKKIDYIKKNDQKLYQEKLEEYVRDNYGY